MTEPTFKPYRQNQMRLLPLDLSEMVPENHMARVVDAVVESLDLSALRSLYPGGGAPAHDPRMMLKVGQKNRRIYVNPHRDALRKKAAARLTSDEGIVLRRRRATDVETVFGDVKRNWGFRRFTLRGIEKVAHEWRLLMMGHNIRKLTRKIAEAGANPALAAAAP